MPNLGRIFRVTVIGAPEAKPVNTTGAAGGYFDQLQTITEFTVDPSSGVGSQIEFDVVRNLVRAPNTCNIVITNLAEENRQAFIGAPVKVVLEAGYDNDPRFLFLGDLRYASNEHEGTEWKTKIQLADGGRAFANAKVSKAYTKGTPVETIVRDLAKAFGVPLTPLAALSNELKARIPSGEVLQGSVADELTRLLDPFDIEWSFQQGRLQILKSRQVLSGSVRLISEDSGMIGAPEMTPPKIIAPPKNIGHSTGRAKPRVPKCKIKHELYPEVSPGEKIKVRSRSLDGTFRVECVKHKGDFFGGDWITEIEATSTADVKIDEEQDE